MLSKLREWWNEPSSETKLIKFCVEERDRLLNKWWDAEALVKEMKGELDRMTQELYDSKYLAAARLKMNNELVERAETAAALAADRKKLLRRANYFLEFVPIGMNDEDVKRFHQLMDELKLELGDAS